MKPTRLFFSLCLFFIFSTLSCDFENVGNKRNTTCDDGTVPACRMEEPDCETGTILAWQNNCYLCVDPETCQPPNNNNQNNQNECTSDANCETDQYCNPCGASSCPDCTDCIPACTQHQCETETELTCFMARPDCGEGRTSVIQDGCWICVDLINCNEVRNTSCDDGTEVSCLTFAEPECLEHEILAIKNECWACVNPQTCEPWGVANCYNDRDCLPEDTCNLCASSSCPTCEDCVGACIPHNCPTKSETVYNFVRPLCGINKVSVILDDLWVCVDNNTCEQVRDDYCDDGTDPICAQVPPTCEEYEILAHQNNCYECVNPITCKPWGEAGCQSDAECSIYGYCSDCATSSGPNDDDCVAGCLAHNCPTESQAICEMIRPDCGPDEVAIATNGCYACVDINTCEPVY
ncbi:MAG: hypothetical protein PF689_09425 [Deltaproteobacteria bacterium]|jgi:hypothetical protein|nr:hypothetical protein [Deltaproteobacteria bacterium]